MRRGLMWVLFGMMCGVTACGGIAVLDEGDPASPPPGAPAPLGTASTGGDSAITVGGTARVTATELHLRDGVGTSATVLGEMPCGASVEVVGGPDGGWWNVRYDALTGWASGSYLVASGAFSASVCGLDAGPLDGGAADEVFTRARSAVGYSYYWGHGAWRADGTDHGTCSGSCPSCTHSGSYGADCSGFIAKVWQVPSASALETDAHPYSTADFYGSQADWQPVPRSQLRPADALVRRANGSGHIALFESGSDPFGDVWLYEARGCATGVVHDLRALDSSYIAIRRDSAAAPANPGSR